MAKVSTVNVATTGNDIGYGLYSLATLLLANGWTLQSCGTGTAGARRTGAGNELTQPEWIAAANTWQIMYRGNVYVTLLRISATSLTVKYAVVAPATVGSATVPDSQVTAANEVAYSTLSMTGSTRAHAITYSDDQNVIGIRSFYLFFTDGTATLRGAVVLEALANDSYDPANAAPYVVSATTTGNSFNFATDSWSWWYSPTSVWATATRFANPYTVQYLFGSGTQQVGVSPWSGLDQGVSAIWGRPSASVVAPGFVGESNTLKLKGVNRSYPSTVNLASGAYVYVGECLVPWQDGTAPL